VSSGGGSYDDTQIKSDLAQETQDRIDGDANLQNQINNLSGGGSSYGQWNLQAAGGQPFAVTSGEYVNFEGSGGIAVTRSGNYITIDGSGVSGGGGGNYDNYQYWRWQVDGTNTTTVGTMSTLNFRAGNGISLSKSTTGGVNSLVITATGGGGGVDLTGYATEAWVSSNYQPKGSYAVVGDSYTKAESDALYEPKGSGGGGATPNLQQVTDVGATTTKNMTANTYFTQDNSWTVGKSGGARIFCSNGTIALKNSGGHNTLQVSATGDVTATQDVTAFSDVRLKENIETLDGSKVYQMRGVSFTKDGRDGSGVIAQELQQIAPELVRDDGEYLSVAYGNLVGYLIEAVKELKAEVEELKRA
jgi:hypothetical protein